MQVVPYNSWTLSSWLKKQNKIKYMYQPFFNKENINVEIRKKAY